MSYFKVYKEGWSDLSYSARLVYIAIACNSDFKKDTSHITRAKISLYSGISNLTVISNATDELEEKDWLRKEKRMEDYKLLITYHLIDRGQFEFVDRKILFEDLTKSELVTFVSLCSIQCDGEICHTRPYMCLGIAKSTYYKNVKSLKEKGFLSGENGETIINSDFLRTEKNITADNQKWMDNILSNKESEGTELYNKLQYLRDTDFKGVVNPNQVIEDYKAGFNLNGKKKKCLPALDVEFEF